MEELKPKASHFMNKMTQRRIASATVIFLLVIGSCWFLYTQANMILSAPSVTDTEIDVEAVEQLLKLAQAHPTGEFPRNDLDPSIKNAFMQHSLKGDSKCWSATQDAVVRNGNSYSISAIDPFRQFGRDVDNSLVTVEFQDGSKIGFTFYQQTMVGCTIETAEVK